MTELLAFAADIRNTPLIVFILWLTFITVCRACRCLLILVRGWPPEHWDEDWSPEK